jgi:hypothetical protein
MVRPSDTEPDENATIAGIIAAAEGLGYDMDRAPAREPVSVFGGRCV